MKATAAVEAATATASQKSAVLILLGATLVLEVLALLILIVAALAVAGLAAMAPFAVVEVLPEVVAQAHILAMAPCVHAAPTTEIRGFKVFGTKANKTDVRNRYDA